MATLTDLLLATQQPDKCAAAEAQIRAAEQNSVEQYFTALAQELAGTGKPTIARQLAGLLLKNGLAAKDPTRDRELKARWAALPVASRTLIKEATTSALIAPELDVGKAAAQVLAKIGSMEVPPGEWPGLVPLLLQHVTNVDPRARQISLITLGYLCEELVMLQEEGITIDAAVSNNILTAVVQGMRETDMTTKLEATRAFYYAVVLAQQNFRNDNERQFIMTVVSEVCRCQGSESVQIAAFECLVQIATEYYDFLSPSYMNVLGPLTWEMIRGANEKVAIPAMEFWSTICDEELYIVDLIASGSNQKQSLNIIVQALQFLIPLLTETLAKHTCVDDDDDDTWNLAMAAGTCLGLVAQVAGNDCVDPVLQFVNQNFENPDWKFREAAVLAYGSIMEGPSTEKLGPMVQSSLSHLVQRMQDPSVSVRDTVAWTLSKVVQCHPSLVPIKDLAPVCRDKLADVPRVCKNVCWVIQCLAEAQPDSAGPKQLDEFFPGLVGALLQVVARPDGGDKQLPMAGYFAISHLVRHAGSSCMDHLFGLVEEMLNQLSRSFSNLERECELQGFICGVLIDLVQRLGPQIQPAANKVMEETLKVIAAYQQVKGTPNVLHDEALGLASELARAIGANFECFMPHFAPQLKVGLENFEDVEVCLNATRVIGDLCRALDDKIITYCDTFLQILYTNLQNTAVDRKIKAAIMPCFGDIALAITGQFEKYLAPVVKMLQEASITKVTDGPPDNEDWIDYLNLLREGVFEAYTGIIHGLRESGKLPLFKEHVNGVLLFVEMTSTDTTVSESVMKAAVGVVGDLVQAFQQELASHLGNAPFLVRLAEYASRSQDPRVKKDAQWLQGLLNQYRGGVR